MPHTDPICANGGPLAWEIQNLNGWLWVRKSMTGVLASPPLAPKQLSELARLKQDELETLTLIT